MRKGVLPRCLFPILTLTPFLYACNGSPVAPSLGTLTFPFSDIGELALTAMPFEAVFRTDDTVSATVRVEWTPSATYVGISLVAGCRGDPGCDGNIEIIAFDNGDSNPKTISRRLPTNTYTVQVLNGGPGAVTGTVTVTLTP